MTVDVWINGVSAEPVNMSNMNAHAILTLIDPDCDFPGSWSVEALPAIRKRLEGLIESTGQRAPAIRKEERPRHNFIICGIDDEYVMLRCSQILALVEKAQQAGTEVVWA